MIETRVFGRLTDVEPRLAWAHEAYAFTPWLAENLDRLSAAIGIPLELTGREVGVGRYSADILASSPGDDVVVLIENQLEASDHTHLGQILTYLAGLEAHVVVWLAPQFREEHLSALRWLNQHTDERYSFFAVRLRVVRIGDSPLAPLFDVLEKPNTWERRVQQKAREVTEPTAATARARAFWERYTQIDPATATDTVIGAAVRWRAVPEAQVVVSRFVSGGEKVGLFLRGLRGRDYGEEARRLAPFGPSLEAALNAPAGSERFLFEKSGPKITDDPTSWDEAIRWLISETNRYVKAAAAIIRSDSSEAEGWGG